MAIINTVSVIDESEVTHYYTDANGHPRVEVTFFPGCHGQLYNAITDTLLPDKAAYIALLPDEAKPEEDD